MNEKSQSRIKQGKRLKMIEKAVAAFRLGVCRCVGV